MWHEKKTAATKAAGTKKTAAIKAAVFNEAGRCYFTPCISFWINGASTNSSTPPPSSDQKPKL